MPEQNSPRPDPGIGLTVAVIGAGMSGILAGVKLREAGVNFTIYEKAERIGGTWRENTYPGLTCDVPSQLYCYSFEPNPDWSHRFPPGPEIQAYFVGVVAKYGLAENLRFNTEIRKAEFLDGRWRLHTQTGEQRMADIVICATGVLHHPVFPHIEGLDSFAGERFHSAQWNHRVALRDQRVGIIGTGSTAVQILPAILDTVKKVSLFQRTAQWILPMPNPAYTEEQKAAFRRFPELMKRDYQKLADQYVNTFARAVVGDVIEMSRLERACQMNLDDNVRDPELKRKLTPNYRVACKRLINSDDFYPAIQKPNAELVTTAIRHIEPGGVRDADGRLHELDVLVLATGFDGHAFMGPMQVEGPDGLRLADAWAAAAQAHRSVAIPGFPNFFLLLGPNSPIGNFCLIQISELQIAYVMQLIDLIREGRCREIAPRREAADRFNQALREAMKDTVWVSGCKSWYLDKNGNPALWPWSFERFAQDMSQPLLEEFQLAG